MVSCFTACFVVAIDYRRLCRCAPAVQERAAAEKRLKALDNTIAAHKRLASACPIRSTRILHRYHFSSKLQRMSVVCTVDAIAGSSMRSGKYCLVKGSPEALRVLFAPGACPPWFAGETSIKLDTSDVCVRVCACVCGEGGGRRRGSVRSCVGGENVQKMCTLAISSVRLHASLPCSRDVFIFMAYCFDRCSDVPAAC